MKKTIKLTEKDLTKIVKRIIKESMWTSTSTWDDLGKKPSSNQSSSFDNYMEGLRDLENRLERGNISDEYKFHLAKDLADFYEDIMGETKFDNMDDEELEQYGHNFTLTERELRLIFDYIRQLDTEYDLGFMQLLPLRRR